MSNYLTTDTFSLIVTLRRSGKPYELRPTDILCESLLTSGAITNRIHRIEEMGLVERRPDNDDRRSYVIQLTPAGKKLADRAIARHFTTIDDLLSDLSSAEQLVDSCPNCWDQWKTGSDRNRRGP